jgi:hypothetical protein
LVATSATQAAVQEAAPLTQHEGREAQIAATQALHCVLSCAPVVHTLCAQVCMLTLHDVPLQYVGTRSRQTSLQPVVQQEGLTAQTAEMQELHPFCRGAPNVQISCAQQVPAPQATSAMSVQLLSQVCEQQLDHWPPPNVQTAAAQPFPQPEGIATPA